jgi:hypothetical protein
VNRVKVDRETEYDLSLAEMVNCYKIHEPVEILSTNDLLDIAETFPE